MAAVNQPDRSHKRKRDSSAPAKERGKKSKKPTTAFKSPLKEPQPDSVPCKEDARTAKERRLSAKENVEASKMKRKPNYNLEKELTSLWEKMRPHKDERKHW